MLSRWFKSYKYGNTRNYLRLPAPWPIKCELQNKSDGLHVSSTSDISAGGVALIIKESIPLGSRLRMEIHVPPLNRSIHAEGLVVRCRPTRTGQSFELGIRFDQIEPRERIALNEAVEQFYSARHRENQRSRAWRRRLP